MCKYNGLLIEGNRFGNKFDIFLLISFILLGANIPKPYGINPLINSVNVPARNELPKALTPFSHRLINAEAMLLGFLAENALPFALAPKLITLAQKLAKDNKTLSDLSMDRTTASYKMKYGLSTTMKNSLVEKLKVSFFSLNIDEATSDNLLHVLTILVSYFCEELKRVVVVHLSSSDLITVNSDSIKNVLIKLFQTFGLPWTNLVSILSDSCNVMRGVKNGVETQIRAQFAPHLLDVDGDTAHHAHNASKRLSSAFNKFAEDVFVQIYNDFKWSTDLRDYLNEICGLLDVNFTMPAQYVPTRWLSVYKVTLDMLRMFDCYTVFYFAFLAQADSILYLNINGEILHRLSVSTSVKDRIRGIQRLLRKKNMTVEGKSRKQKICHKLFHKRKELQIILNFYASVFPQLQKYALLSQKKEPMIHRLHDEIMSLVKEFLSNFLKPELLAGNPKKISNIDVGGLNNWLPDKDIFLGNKAFTLLKSLKKDDQLYKDILQKIKTAYSVCGKYLLEKMPINNKFLQAASAIDPQLKDSHSSIVLAALKVLPQLLSTVLNEDELDDYDLECRRYILDNRLPVYETNSRVDEYWSKINSQGNYPNLTKIVKAVLSCFHGPQVESSFSIMSNIIQPGRSRLNMTTYDSLQTVTYQLMAEEKSSTDYFYKTDPIHDPIDPMLVQNMKSAYKTYNSEQDKIKSKKEAKKNKLQIQKNKVISTKKALESAEIAQKAAKKAHRHAMLIKLAKRKRSENQQRYYPTSAHTSQQPVTSLIARNATKRKSKKSSECSTLAQSRKHVTGHDVTNALKRKKASLECNRKRQKTANNGKEHQSHSCC